MIRSYWLGKLAIFAGPLMILAAPITFIADLIKSSTQANQKTPEAVMRSFLSDLLRGDIARAS